MPIIRAKHNKDFTQIKNATLREKGLSLRARGLLAYMLSFPDNWEFSVCNIVAETGESDRTVRRILAELEKQGFIYREQSRDDLGKFEDATSWVFETATARISRKKETAETEAKKISPPSAKTPPAEKPSAKTPPAVNCRRKNNEYKRISKERILSSNERTVAASYDAVLDLVEDSELRNALHEYIQMRFYIKKPPTNAALKHYIARVFALYPDDADLRLQCVRQSVLNSRPNAFPLPSENSKPSAPDAFSNGQPPPSSFATGLSSKRRASSKSPLSAAERRARHAESMRDSWQIILSDIEAEREDG